MRGRFRVDTTRQSYLCPRYSSESLRRCVDRPSAGIFLIIYSYLKSPPLSTLSSYMVSFSSLLLTRSLNQSANFSLYPSLLFFECYCNFLSLNTIIISNALKNESANYSPERALFSICLYFAVTVRVSIAMVFRQFLFQHGAENLMSFYSALDF